MRVWLLFLIALPLVSAAQLSGTVYDFELQKVPLAVVEVNSSPAQRMVATNGSFSFALAPGEYEVKVSLPRSNLTSIEVVEIQGEGSFVYDVILLPDLEDELLESDMVDIPFFEDVIEDTPKSSYAVWVAVAVAIGVALFAATRPRAIVKKQVVHERVVEKVALQDDLQQVLTVLEKLGNRASQKDIRKELPHSEAKVSLMLDELEQKGLVERVKKGRGNVVIRK